MDTDEFKAIGADLFGNSWQTRMARAMGVDGSSVRRWVGGAVPVPPAVQAYLRTFAERQRVRGALVFERTSRGPAIAIEPTGHATLAHMERRLPFPGVEQLKPMPSIHVGRTGERAIATLDGGPADVVPAGISCLVVRHPDTAHLAGYVDAARRAGVGCVAATHRFHHYTLALPAGGGPDATTFVIATHAGELRTVSIPTDGTAAILQSSLDTLGV